MSSTSEPIHLEDWIRDIPDFPQKGILFKDITPLLQDAAAFRAAMERLAAHYKGSGIQTVVVDELLATGGTVSAAMQLVEKLGGHIAGIAFLVELTFLRGREQLKGHDVFALIKY